MAEEKRFEWKVRDYLESIGAWVVKYHGNAMSANGTPDLLVCYCGVFMAIEVKATKGKPTELQKYKIKKINEACGVGLVLWPDGFEDFKRLCKGVAECACHIQGLNALKTALTSTRCDIFPKLER